MSLTKKPLTAIHYFTLQIIGGILVVVGIVSLSRGEKSILGLGILVGLFVLIVPGILKSHRIPRVSEARSVDRGRARRAGNLRPSDFRAVED